MTQVLVLIGGISAGSLNRRFFEAAREAAQAEVHTEARTAAKGAGAGVGSGGALEFTVFEIASLPFYSQDLESAPPASVAELKKLASAADGVLIVTPEYNRSIPGVLKNALDWGSRIAGAPDGKTGNVWAGKPTAIMGASPGAIGTFGAQQHLRAVCSWLDMPVMNQPTVYFNASTGMMNAAGTPTADGDRLTENSAAFLGKFLASFEAWIALFKGRR